MSSIGRHSGDDLAGATQTHPPMKTLAFLGGYVKGISQLFLGLVFQSVVDDFLKCGFDICSLLCRGLEEWDGSLGCAPLLPTLLSHLPHHEFHQSVPCRPQSLTTAMNRLLPHSCRTLFENHLPAMIPSDGHLMPNICHLSVFCQPKTLRQSSTCYDTIKQSNVRQDHSLHLTITCTPLIVTNCIARNAISGRRGSMELAKTQHTVAASGNESNFHMLASKATLHARTPYTNDTCRLQTRFDQTTLAS